MYTSRFIFIRLTSSPIFCMKIASIGLCPLFYCANTGLEKRENRLANNITIFYNRNLAK
jgi:hypothetical protein